MFGSRRKWGSNPPPFNVTNANPNAATAAAQAFLKNQASNASLAAAAAGAALRSRPTTPTSVADVQTKRMLRRAGSTSSVGSSTAGSIRGPPDAALERRGSNSSMSERTFRDSSPSQHVPSAADAPPVPALPRNIPMSNSHRRTASMEAAPGRMLSPPPNITNGRGSSLGPRPTTTPPKRSGQGMSSLSEEQSMQRSGNRGSLNFSLPTARRAESPFYERQLTTSSPDRSQQPRITSPNNQNLVYDANTRSFLPYTEILAIEQRIRNVASQPIKKKKRIVSGQSTGTHFAQGTMGRPHGTAVNAIEAASHSNHSIKPAEPPAIVPILQYEREPESEPLVEPPALLPAVSETTMKKVASFSDSESEQGSYLPNSSDNDSDFRSSNTITGAILAKKPSIVREDREQEEREDDTPPKKIASDQSPKSDIGTRTFSPSPLPRSAAGRGLETAKTPASTSPMPEQQQTRPISQPMPDSGAISMTENGENGLTPNSSSRNGRVQSMSPVRTTHFATTPDKLMVKHQPPGRSISPRKSALKYSSLERSSSPGGDLSADNGSVVGRDDSPMPRKKPVRVSFDDSNVIVGEAAGAMSTDSPIAPSPQVAKRSWFSLSGRAKKKDPTAVSDDDDEVMKPRPALPSFGSVRGRNIREPMEERQLVKPAEHYATVPSPPLTTGPPVEVKPIPTGQSNDHSVGAILSQDAASKNEANTSKSREPLPPQVVSVEGSGYHSDSDSTISVLDDTYRDHKRDSTQATRASPDGETEILENEKVLLENAPNSTQIESIHTEPRQTEPKQTSHEVLQISLTQPTPIMEHKEWLPMPGGFPEGGSDSGSVVGTDDIGPPNVEHVTDLTPTLIGIAESHGGPGPGSPVLGDMNTALENPTPHPAIAEETEDSDTTSIYSDAAEDLSDLEGDGFQSLAAVVDSPVVSRPPSELVNNTAPEIPTIKSSMAQPSEKNHLSKKKSEPTLDEGWGKAQAYWSGLTSDKKRQLEQEARVEAEDTDSTIEAKPQPKPKAKEKVAVVAPPLELVERPQPYKHERTYMIQPGTSIGKDGYTPAMKKTSMRAGPPSPTADTQIKKSMRGPTSMHGSLRGAERVEPKKKQRPVSMSASEIRADPNAVKMHIRALSAASASVEAGRRDTPAPLSLRRRGSGDSDSSFKRAKPAEFTNFRRSMRSSTDQPGGRQLSPLGSSRFSLRSMSPTGSNLGPRSLIGRPPVSMPPTQMRSSMRNPHTATSLRGSKSERAKSPIRIPGFGRSSKSAKQKPVSAQSSSRFADSSDEDEIRPAFRSRFVDSSDEDDGPARLPEQGGIRTSMRANQPVRAIPRRAGVDDGDSSDLPDSDDEKSPTSPGAKLAKVRQNGTPSLGATAIRRSGSGKGVMSPPITTSISGPQRPNQSRRGSFMSMLRRKKADPSSKVRKSDAESAARRDTPLERSKSDLMAIKRQESYNSTNGNVPVSSPKLQKRGNTASWPLPPQPLAIANEKVEEDRPFTADAADGIVGGETERPNLGTRRSTATGLGIVDMGGPVDATPARKKKKFQALRKMFRLDD